MLQSTLNKIALFLYSLDGGGAERVMVNLANNFSERGLRVDVVLVKVKGPYLDQLSPKVKIVDLQVRDTLSSLPSFIAYLRRERPVVVISTMHYANEVALWSKQLSRTGTRTVVCEQNTLSVYAKSTGRKVEKLTPLWSKLFYPWSDCIVAASKGVKSDLIKVTNLSPQQVRVIYNPINTQDLVTQAKATLDHPWYQPGQPPVILGVGRLTPQKDFSTLIRAFAQVRQILPARLVILGNNYGCGPALKNLVKDLNLIEDVDMPGFVDNPYVYMAKSQVFVLSSKWEGFGNVIVEALAVGTPVVSTNCESGPVEILDGGKYGELVPVGDDLAMAQAIIRVLSGERKSVPDQWIQQFDHKIVAQQYLEAAGLSVEMKKE